MKNNYILKSHYALIVFSVILLILNVLPAFKIGFYQDDYKGFLNLVADNKWNFKKFVFANPLDTGFRPLACIDRIIFFNIFGENPIAHRFYLLIIHGLILILVYRISLLLTNNKNQAAFSLFIYAGCNFTLQTMYSSVAINWADIAILIIIHEILQSNNNPKIGVGKILWILLLQIIALGNRENGIIILPVVLIVMHYLDWKILSSKSLSILIPLSVITVGYFIVYYWSTLSISNRTIGHSTLQISSIKMVLNGIIQSINAPLVNAYRSLRLYYGFTPTVSLGLLIVSVTLILIPLVKILKSTQEKIKWNPFITNLKYLTILCCVLLSPYILNSYFEPRMMLVSFAIGSIFWSCYVYWVIKSSFTSILKYTTILGYGFLLLPFISLSVPPSIENEYQVSRKLVEIIDSLTVEKISTVGLYGFNGKVGYLRSGNAKGIVEYKSAKTINVVYLKSIEECKHFHAPIIVSSENDLLNTYYIINNK
jgi:hypothetical protein